MTDAQRHSSYVEHAPPAALRGSVSSIWTRSTPAGALRVLPDGCMDILLLETPSGWCGYVVGTLSRALLTNGTPLGSCGVRFEVGEATRFFGVSALSMTDRIVRLGDVWGCYARELEDAVSAAHDDDCRARILFERLSTHSTSSIVLARLPLRTTAGRREPITPS